MLQQKQIAEEFIKDNCVDEEADRRKPSLEKALSSAEKVAEASQLAQEVIDAIRTPLLVLGSGMQVETANNSFCRVFDVSKSDVEQRCFYALDASLWDIPLLRLSLENISAHDMPFEDMEVELEFPRIGRRTILLNGRRLVRQATAVPLILLALEDISERRRAERLQQIQMQKLEWSNRELQDFAYIASHDLQEPLRAIQAFGERLKTRAGEELSADSSDYLERMLRAASRMRVLIHDLLEFSRVTTKARPFALVDLNLAAQQALADLATRCEETQGRVIVEPLSTLEADATQMRQLLQNLIDNALKYGRDSVPPVITVSSEVSQEKAVLQEQNALPAEMQEVCRIEVQDNGIGFEEKYADRIFAPFQRLHSRGQYDGTGIGLAICRKIVERHGGRISAQSIPGEGSLFTIVLPVHQSEEA